MTDQTVPIDFHIFTTLRHDNSLQTYPQNDLPLAPSKTLEPSPFYMLPHHLARLTAAAQAFDFETVMSILSSPNALLEFSRALNAHLETTYGPISCAAPFRIRVAYSAAGKINITSASVPPLGYSQPYPEALDPNPQPDTQTWRIYLYSNLVPASLYTTHKTSHREVYEAARSKIPPQTQDEQSTSRMTEILLQNPEGEITEGTRTTPYFWRAGKWITPRASAGGNLGTTRRWALEAGLCMEGEVLSRDVREGELVWLSNGVRGFGWGRIELSTPDALAGDCNILELYKGRALKLN